MEVPQTSTNRSPNYEDENTPIQENPANQFTYDEDAFIFDRDTIKYVDYSLYAGHRTHFLINALTTNSKLPSEKSMIRCQQRNKRKWPQIRQKTLHQRRREGQKFEVPNKYGKKPAPRRNLRLQRFKQPQRGNHQNNIERNKTQEKDNLIKQRQSAQLISQSAPRGFCFTQLINLQFLQLDSNKSKVQNITQMNLAQNEAQKNKKLPAEIIRKKKNKREPKTINKTFKVHSPEWIELKAKRQKAQKMIEEFRKKPNSKSKAFDLTKSVPEYYQKKKRNQHRRRLEKHTLIVNNRHALRQIFGDAIFKSGWPVSRKQIKQALGIEEQKSQGIQDITDLLKEMNE